MVTGQRVVERGMEYLYGCAHEQFPPDDLLRQAVEAEEAGFDGISCSDHLQPWWEGGEAGHAWVWLGAVGQATKSVPIGTAVTPPGPRHHPVLIAQAWATLEAMFPGRPFLGFGSGESLNETPLGADWPATGAQVGRMREALEIINALLDGERLDYEGEHFTTNGCLPPHAARAQAADLRLRVRSRGGGGRGHARGRALDAGRSGDGAGDHRALPRGLIRRRPRGRRDRDPGAVLLGPR